MSSLSTKKVSTIALLTSAVFAISSLAPIEFAPGPFSPDAAFAKSENANNGNRGGNGGGNGNGNGNGKGGEKSAANGGGNANKGGGQGGGKGGGKGLGKGVGGLFANATAKGGNLINKVLGRDKVKTHKAATSSAHSNGKTKPKDLLAEMGYHPSDVKGWNGVFHANPNAALHASVNSIHGRAAEFFAQQMIADTAAADAQLAAEAYETALGYLDLNSIDQDLTGAEYDAAVAALAEERLAELAAELEAEMDLIDPDLTEAEYDAAVAALVEANATEIAALTDFGDATTVQALQETADMEQADAEAAFTAVTPNVEYSTEKAADFYTMIEDNQAMVDRVAGIVDPEAAPAATEEDVVLLKTGDGETIEVVVE